MNLLTDDTNELRSMISDAFSRRAMPAGRIIKRSVDLDNNCEAQDVDKFLRMRPLIIDRSNPALAAFHYLSTEAALWVLPFYLCSIMSEFENDDFLIDKIAWVLNAGLPGPDAERLDGLGRQMLDLSSKTERAAVCAFCQWLEANAWEPGGPDTMKSVIGAWCAHA